MKGDIVLLRSFGNIPLLRRVWDIGENVVYICSEERYNDLSAGKTYPIIGFPKKDVFEYDNSIPLEEIANDPRIWERLNLWNCGNAK